MNHYKYTFTGRCLLYMILMISFLSKAQVKYPSDSTFISTLSHRDKNNFLNFSYIKIDSSITNFQNYFPRNTNGHLGQASSPLFVKNQSQSIGFQMYNAPYQNDMIKGDDVKYYQTKGPYASLTGIAGSKQEQSFKLLFSNTFKNKLNLTLTFNRYSGIGFYKYQQSFTNNLYITSNYHSANNRVGYYAYVLFNKLKHQENGGLSNDSLFLENVNINKFLLPLNLTTAKREYRSTSFDFNPWFRLNKTDDSSTVLSHYVDYQLHYSGNYTKYTDTKSGSGNFYNVYYLDTVASKDSTHWRTISNGLNYILKISPINTKIKFGYKNEVNQTYQHSDSLFMNHFVDAGVYFSSKNYAGFLKGSYIVQGSNQNDYLIELGNRYIYHMPWRHSKLPIEITLNASAEKRHPDFIFNTWLSNHYAWSNRFLPTDKLQSTLVFSSTDHRFDIGVVIQSIDHFIYFNEQAVPAQSPISIQNISAFIHKDILLFKHLGISGKYNYQSSSYQAIVSIPNHIINGAIYYQGNLFKNALQLQVGFNAQYFSEFYGYAYMPATNQYYVQTTKTVGNYPFVDFFLNARIKPVRFFVKIDHVTQGLLGSGYSLTPGYIQNDRAFKFGLNWLFFD